MKKTSIAVIGGGVSGIVASHYLSKAYNVTLFEKNNYIGGHTNTVVIASGPDEGLAVDTGFIVCNDKTYPEFHGFLSDLGVQVRNADMSFGYYNVETNFQYAGTNLGGLFAQTKNLFSLSYLLMLKDILSFNRNGLKALSGERLKGVTLGDFLKKERISDKVINDYLLPMGAAIWSSPDADLLSFPAETFFSFFRNHGLLEFHKRPQWQTVVGGSFEYVKRFLQEFRGEVYTEAPVISVKRKDSGVVINTSNLSRKFDYCIIATHADEALKLLEDPTKEEMEALGAWSYHENLAVLHTDDRCLPPLKRARASWNYRRERGVDGKGPVSVTYYMNNLQGFEATRDYCVTLNPKSPIDEDKVIAQFIYTHPAYTQKALDGRSLLKKLMGDRGTFYCGSYFGFGFHEDAVKSARSVVSLLQKSE
jgi:predicted NAD/FAD-binding protein